jgi:hypothetical protein
LQYFTEQYHSLDFVWHYIIGIMNFIKNVKSSLAPNVLQISEGTNSVGIVQLDLGFCLCAVISRLFLTDKLN